MLTESYLLWQALERAGLAPERNHPRVRRPGKSGPFVRVRLGGDGTVLGLESMTDDEEPGLWTVIEGNHNSFPVVRLKEPLLAVPADDQFWNPARSGSGAQPPGRPRQGALLRDALLDAMERLPVLKPSKGTEDLWKRLRDQKATKLEAIARGKEGIQPVAHLARRFRVATADPQMLAVQLMSTAARQLLAGWTDGLDAAAALLIGRRKKENAEHETAVQLAFDLDVGSPRIYDERVRRKLIEALLASDQATDRSPHPGESCAFTGQPERLLTSPFPKVHLPVLNRDFPLMSMFEEADCNRRYGLTGSGVVPVSETAALRMQDALKYIVSTERRGMTWRGVASGKSEVRNRRRNDKQDLLIAYVEGKPDLAAPVASLFGAGPGTEEKQFEIAAQAVCEALDGIAQERPDSRLNLFIIRGASLGQAQVVLADAPTVQEVLAGARRWQDGSANVPPIVLPFPIGKNQKADWRAPHAPYLSQVVRLLGRQWVLDARGASANYCHGVQLGEVLDLMLRKPGKWQQAAQHLLDLALQRTQNLLIALFAAWRSDTERRPQHRIDRYSTDARTAALGAASLLGLLLHSLGRNKESYMDSAPFLVGKLLALADLLHREYCEHVRGGSIPPQLIGNAFMPVARDNPDAALDRLSERLRIYKAWADKVKGSEAPLAKWTLSQMGDVARDLHNVGRPAKMGETDRAELLLGYIARAAGSGASGSPETIERENP